MTGRTDASREGTQALDGNGEAPLPAPMKWRPLVPAFVALVVSYFVLMLVIVNDPLGRFLFQGDTLGVHRIFLDAFKFEQFPLDGYRIPVAPYYFPDWSLWFILASLLPYEAVYVLYCFIFLVISAVGWVFVCRQLGASSAFQSAAVFAHVLQILLLTYSGNEIFMLLVTPNFHTGIWIFMPWLLWAFLNGSWVGKTTLFILVALLALSDLIVLPWFVGPFFVAVGIVWWRGGFSSRRVLESYAIVALAAVVGRSLFNLYMPFAESQDTSNFLSIKIAPVFSHLAIQVTGLLVLAGQYGWLAAIWLLFVALALFVFVRHFYAEEVDPNFLFMLTFILTAVLISVAAPALTGKVGFLRVFPQGLDFSYFNVLEIGRHIHPALYLPLFVGWPFLIFIGSRWLGSLIPIRSFHFSVVSLVVCVVAAIPGVVRSRDFQNFSPLETPYAVCVRKAARRLGWTGGIGIYGFWNQAVVDPENPIKQNMVVNNIEFFRNAYKEKSLWVMWDATNRHWYSGEFQVVAVDKYKGRRFFAPPRRQEDGCLLDSQCAQYVPSRSLDEKTVRGVFGDPQEIVECEGVALFHYDPPLIYDFSDHAQVEDFPVILFLRNPGR